MYLTKVDDQTYEVWLYCWTTLHEDYLAGHLVRESEVTAEDSDWYYWHFEPNKEVMSPINCGDLRKISERISEMNKVLSDEFI